MIGDRLRAAGSCGRAAHPARARRRGGRGASRGRGRRHPTRRRGRRSCTSCSTRPAGPPSQPFEVCAMSAGFVPPPYPYDRLSGLAELAERHEGGMVDCSIGTPVRPTDARGRSMRSGGSGLERGYPTSQGSAGYRQAIAGLAAASLRASRSIPAQIAGCVGTKEMVASTAHYLSLRDPGRATSCSTRPSRTRPTPWERRWPGSRPVAVPMEEGRLELEDGPRRAGATSAADLVELTVEPHRRAR